MIITDTGSYSDIVFALITLLGFDYRPQLADLPDAKLWRILISVDTVHSLDCVIELRSSLLGDSILSFTFLGCNR